MATKELTIGNPLKLIISFTIPILLGNIFQQFYSLVDALIVGRFLGINALAAVGATAPYIFLIISFIFASTQGFTVITAQKFGAHAHNLVRKSFTACVILSTIITIFMTLLSTPLSYTMLDFLKTPSDIIMMANQYQQIMFFGIFATVFYNLASNVIRALGDSKTPLYFLIFASFLNIGLDILFIVKFNMGISGAAWATVISQGISTILCLLYMFKKFTILKLKKQDWMVSKGYLMEHVNVGIPMGFQMSVLTIGIIALQYAINTLGSTAVAAYTAAMRVDQIFGQAYVALGATMAVYTAQNFGANKLSRIRDGVKISIALVISFSIFAILILSNFSETFVSWFMSEANHEVIRLAALYLHIIMFFFVFLGFLFIFRSILQGMGRVKAPLISGVTELIARTVCAFILGNHFGYLGVCFATPAAWVGATIVLYIGYKFSLKKHLFKLKNTH